MPALCFAPALLRPHWQPVRVAMIYSPEYANAAHAARMSAAEAQRAATLLKREFVFQAIPTESRGPKDGDWTGVIIATAGTTYSVESVAIDISGANCSANVLTLQPPRAQCRNQRCGVWHHSLERFGAAQLNDRFKAARIAADDHAWLGWFAVKLLWESGVRGKHPKELSYDGHKGTALRFNDGGVLMQPIYVLNEAGDAIIEEIRPNIALEAAACGA